MHYSVLQILSLSPQPSQMLSFEMWLCKAPSFRFSQTLRCPQLLVWTSYEPWVVAGATAYFGFGALMNKISLRMRGICPQSSCAAKLPGFRLVFGGSHGMATVLRSKNRCSPWGASYGVLRREKTLRQHRKLLWRAGSTRGNQNLSCTGSLGLCQDHLVVSEVIFRI